MPEKPIHQATMAGILAAIVALAAATVAVPTQVDGLWGSIAAFGIAVAAMFTLRVYYPPVVCVIAVIAILSSPQTFAAVTAATSQSYCLSGILIAWSILWLRPVIGRLEIAAFGAVVLAVTMIAGTPQMRVPQNLLLIPEWHLVLALLGVFAAIRRRHTDPMGLWILCALGGLGMLMPSAVQQAMFAPLIGLGGGRVLYRGTLTKSFRIPPAGWAMVLLAVAAVRSAVIMVTWAPHWGDYQNRIGLLLERSK